MMVSPGVEEEGAYRMQDGVQMQERTFNPCRDRHLSGLQGNFKDAGHGVDNGLARVGNFCGTQR